MQKGEKWEAGGQIPVRQNYYALSAFAGVRLRFNQLCLSISQRERTSQGHGLRSFFLLILSRWNSSYILECSIGRWHRRSKGLATRCLCWDVPRSQQYRGGIPSLFRGISIISGCKTGESLCFKELYVYSGGSSPPTRRFRSTVTKIQVHPN